MAPPMAMRDVRGELAAELLRGSGIEIGALHLPTGLPPGVRARYVDRMTVPELRAHYPELDGVDLAPIHIVDDGERLSTIPDDSLDFIVANHFLEHCEDPIQTIETHLSKLRPGGLLFYAVPDKRYTFDFRRPRTLLSHVVDDHERGPEHSHKEHYLEWARLVYPEGTEPPDEQAARRQAEELEASGYSIHFHVWTQADVLELVLHCRKRFGSFDLEAFRRGGPENIVVLRKRGHSVEESSHEVSSPAVNDEHGTDVDLSLPRPTVEETIPLAALRQRLDVGAPPAEWAVGFDGVPGRALVLSVGSPLRIPLQLSEAVRLSGQVRLVPHDWREGDDAVRAWVGMVGADGSQRELWSASLAAAARQRRADGVTLDCELPAAARSLLLGVDQPPSPTHRSVGRAMWVETEIVDPSAPPPPTRAAETVPATSRPNGKQRSGPLISVLTPVHDPPLAMLEQAIASVLGQSFTDWELCLVDDGSRDPAVVAALTRHAAEDRRIHLVRREEAGGISIATNAALELAGGEYVALLDHDDTLALQALEFVAHRLETEPDLDMIYTDEDVIEADGARRDVKLKPDWSPETLCSMMYTLHLGVYRRSLAHEIGGFRRTYDGTQDYDFVLRLIERTDRIAHIPVVLYHWRAHARSSAGAGEMAKPRAYIAQRAAIGEHLERTGVTAEVQFGALPGIHRIVHRVDPSVTASLVLALTTESPPGDAVTEAARSWLSQPHSSWEIVLAAPTEILQTITNAICAAGVNRARIVTIPADQPSDPIATLTAAARAARSEHLLLMRSAFIGLTHDWLRRLLGYSAQPEIGAAGPIVLAANGRIKQAGVAMPTGVPLYLHHGRDGAEGPLTVANVIAVDGIVATRRKSFDSLGGLQPELGEFALIDYCLRARERRLRSVIVPDARVRGIGPNSCTTDLARLWQLRRRWHRNHTYDPYYNPHYKTDRGDFILGAKP